VARTSSRDDLAADGATAVDGAPSARRVQMSVQLQPDLRKRLRLTAVFLERELSELVEEGVARYLDQIDRERREQGMRPIPKPEARPG
jgi:hypothetical protein